MYLYLYLYMANSQVPVPVPRYYRLHLTPTLVSPYTVDQACTVIDFEKCATLHWYSSPHCHDCYLGFPSISYLCCHCWLKFNKANTSCFVSCRPPAVACMRSSSGKEGIIVRQAYLHFYNSLRPSDTIWWQRWVNRDGSRNGLLPDGTKPFHEPMLTDYQRSPLTFILGQFHKRGLNHSQGPMS